MQGFKSFNSACVDSAGTGREEEMGRRQCKNSSNNLKGNMTSPESREHETRRIEHPTPEEIEEIDSKRIFMKIIEELKQEVKICRKEMEDKYTKKIEEMSKEMEEKYTKRFEEMSKSVNEILGNQEKTIKQVMETVQDLKTEMESMKKSQAEGRLAMENLGKRTETSETSITNRIQEIEERISDSEDTIEKLNALTKENSKFNKFSSQNIQEMNTTGELLRVDPNIADWGTNITTVNGRNHTGIPLCSIMLSTMTFLSLIIALVGLIGNAVVLWLLGFHLQRNGFSVYILNLAGADFLFLCFHIAHCLHIILDTLYSKDTDIPLFFFIVLNVAYLCGLSMLSAISIERSLSVRSREGESPNRLERQNPVYAEEASPSVIVNGFSKRLRASHIQRICLDHVLVQSQSNRPWFTPSYATIIVEDAFLYPLYNFSFFVKNQVEEGEYPNRLDPKNPVYAEEKSPSVIVNGFSERLRASHIQRMPPHSENLVGSHARSVPVQLALVNSH
ncbi:hypothetical protein U0070_000831 [Myodes glareolus]|uniref:G-protein coupled receptors family 1 profile domain-containing protein n=1 Tax=Myodes glareolus TaxID=447135 RepID=A0AAW0HHI1_MYOGA